MRNKGRNKELIDRFKEPNTNTMDRKKYLLMVKSMDGSQIDSIGNSVLSIFNYVNMGKLVNLCFLSFI
jgi:hypothetical protein